MIPSVRLIYEFDRRYDRIKTEFNKVLRIEDKLSILNESQTLLFKGRASLSEKNSEFRNDLRYLEDKEVELEFSNKGSYSIAKLPKDFYKILRKRLIASNETCGQKELTLVTMDTNDLNFARKNPFFKSSYEWEHCLCDEGSEGLYLFHDNEFKINKVIIDYYRRPLEIHCPSLSAKKEYVSWNGELIKKDQGAELEDNLEEIVNIAILIARADLGDIQDYKTKLDQIINVQKLNRE